MRSRGGLWLGVGIDPAGVNMAVQRLRHLGVDFAAKTGQAAEGCLDVTSGTAKTVIEIEMPKGGVEIVVPHQPHHASTEPHTFRVSGRTIDGLRRFDEFVGLALTVLGRVGRRGRICGRLA